jgi:hypothetical protein
MSITRHFLLFQFAILITDQAKQNSMPVAPSRLSSTIDNHIADLIVCQQTIIDDCKSLIERMLKCQQMIFHDPGYSYQQYVENINVHKQILAKYQSVCEGTPDDYLTNDAFQWRRD